MIAQQDGAHVYALHQLINNTTPNSAFVSTEMTISVRGDTPLTIRPNRSPAITGTITCRNTYMANRYPGSIAVVVRYILYSFKGKPKINSNNPSRMQHWSCICLDMLPPQFVYINTAECTNKNIFTPWLNQDLCTHVYLHFRPKRSCTVSRISNTRYRLTYSKPGDYKVTCAVINSKTSSQVDSATTVIDVRQRMYIFSSI